MDKNKSLGINAILNVIRTVLALVAPLITYPYVYRILGAKNLGSVNYTLSIVQYFVLFSGLGISTYGIREGAKKRDDIVKVSTSDIDNGMQTVLYNDDTEFAVIEMLYNLDKIEDID